MLILAFVLATAATSYHNAQEAVHTEANAVDHFVEVADFFPQRRAAPPDADRRGLLTRAVRHFEWPAMSHGEDSTVPSAWTTDLRTVFKRAARAPGSHRRPPTD
ncbi:hypothetical protein [Streptomyces sp. NPDC007100]|uniref:bestrophin-like domain n=1 Tax=Streptomyces sp. NPDC007100 TaxID=3155602 RepID=UPI0033FAA873